MWSQVIFIVLLLGCLVLIRQRVLFIRKCILQGRSFKIKGDRRQRWKQLIWIALGQKRMFSRPWAAVFHFFIYIGFILINVFLLEVIWDGISGDHRSFAKLWPAAYPHMISFIEWLAVLVVLACVVFLIRRGFGQVPRLAHTELRGWPKWDAYFILLIEVLLISAILYMNAADTVLQQRVGAPLYPEVGVFSVSQWLSVSTLSTSSLIILERSCWWIHVFGVLAFAYYITYSKHMHIVLAFPNTYYASLQPSSVSDPMPEVAAAIDAMQSTAPGPEAEPTGRLGAKDVHDLSWQQLLSAFSCTECGRCTDVCPAQQSGKQLSPRKIMMDIRDRATARVKNPESEEQKSLLFDYIQPEELHACTTCQACVEACPILINPIGYYCRSSSVHSYGNRSNPH